MTPLLSCPRPIACLDTNALRDPAQISLLSDVGVQAAKEIRSSGDDASSWLNQWELATSHVRKIICPSSSSSNSRGSSTTTDLTASSCSGGSSTSAYSNSANSNSGNVRDTGNTTSGGYHLNFDVSLADPAVDIAYQKIHSGQWDTVNDSWRKAYACSCVLAGILRASEDPVGALRMLDMSLIFGGTKSITGLEVSPIVEALVESIKKQESSTSGEASCSSSKPVKRRKLDKSTVAKRNPSSLAWSMIPSIRDAIDAGLIVTEAIATVDRPSMSEFKRICFVPRMPHKITGIVNMWPAYGKWTLAYLRRTVGTRTVPVEIGRDYTQEKWSQELMTVEAFIDSYIETGRTCTPNRGEGIGYLAQHQFFDQVPSLGRDIIEPDYCIFTDKVDGQLPFVHKNFWCGPAGTLSPLHYDRYHNLLCQVKGTKSLLLVRPHSNQSSEIDPMYPSEELGFNTSMIDLQNRGWEDRFPEARGFVCKEVVLNAGEMVFIPKNFWHIVLAEDISISVSFWWQ